MPAARSTTPLFPPRLRRVALMVCAALAGTPVLVHAQAEPADEPPVLRPSLGLGMVYDDNLTRGNATTGVTSDFITQAEAGATFHRGYGQQLVDASLKLSRSLYRFHASEDFTAVNGTVMWSTPVGRDGYLQVDLNQTSDLLPLDNFQSLVRDVVTQRTAMISGHYDLGVKWRLESALSHGWYSNDAPVYAYNDNQSNTGMVGVVWLPSQDTSVGLRTSLTTLNYSQVLSPAAATQIGTGSGGATPTLAAPFVANYEEHQLSPWFSWTPTTGVVVRGNLAEVDRSYDEISGQNVRSLFGTLGLDYDRKGRISGGASIHRELGGSLLLASRLVETDGVEVHARYALDSLTRVDGRMAFDRRRYSVDSPGLPAHREYQSQARLAVTRDLVHGLSMSLEGSGDWRRSNPSEFGYTDRRLMAQLRYQL